MKRRHFLKIAAGSVAGVSILSPRLGAEFFQAPKPLFKISLAEWSLVKSLRGGEFTNLDFPRVAKERFGIDCIEFVDQFFADKATDEAYLSELKKRAEQEGVRMQLIMLDTNGPLGAVSAEERDRAVQKTFQWIDAAAFLGCQAVRVNAYGPGDGEELRKRIVESCSRLADYAQKRSIDVAIENHGGLSSDPEWLVSVMQGVGKENFGTLPDFGNFPDTVDRYRAVEMMMPHAKAVSAKSMRFTQEGEVAETDYRRMMRIVRDGGYHDYVGVESGGENPEGEARAVRLTRDLLNRVRSEQETVRPIFNGENLDGWTKIEGGDWAVDDGVLIGKNGRDWTTNPERTGSWLSTDREYADFHLELQFTVNEGGNSGIFFRSAHEKNPAFTGYEMQIHASPGRPPSKGGPGSLYDVVAPSKNMIRPPGEWNYVSIEARGQRAWVEMNGERIIDTELDRATKGYIGLQNHDERSIVQFKNIRLRAI